MISFTQDSEPYTGLTIAAAPLRLEVVNNRRTSHPFFSGDLGG